MAKKFQFLLCFLFLLLLDLWSQDSQQCYLAIAVEDADKAEELPYFLPQDKLRLYIKMEQKMEVRLFLFSPDKELLYEYSSAKQSKPSQEILLPQEENFWKLERPTGHYELFLTIGVDILNKVKDLKAKALYTFLNSQYKDIISLSNVEELPYIVTGAIYNNQYSEDDLNLSLLEISGPQQELKVLRNHSKMIIIDRIYINKFTVRYE